MKHILRLDIEAWSDAQHETAKEFLLWFIKAWDSRNKKNKSRLRTKEYEIYNSFTLHEDNRVKDTTTRETNKRSWWHR